MHHRIEINRAPVLTLWAAVVAERLGFDWQEALTLGRAVAELNAYSKGKALGLFEPTPEAVLSHSTIGLDLSVAQTENSQVSTRMSPFRAHAVRRSSMIVVSKRTSPPTLSKNPRPAL